MKNSLLQKITIFFIILVFGLLGVKSLFQKGYYTSHDGWHQVVRLFYYDKTIKEAVFPPKYVTNLFLGYGYPLFIFNYHLPWLIAEPFIFFGFSVFDSIKAVYILGFILSGLTMFIWLKNRFGNLEAFIGAFLYMWAPYRFSNIFVRGAIGEATVFIFIPLLFLAIDLLKKKFNWSAVVLGAVSVGCILISHAIVAFLVLSLSSIYFLSSITFSKNKIMYLFRLILFVFLGLFLVSYYLVPSISLRKYTKFDTNIQGTKNEGQFATLSELIYSKWGYGFAVPRAPDSMSFQLGVAQWLTISFLLFTLIFYIFVDRKTNRIKNKDFLISLLVIFSLSIFLITPQSLSFWKNVVDRLFIVDFSWRLLTVAVFTSAALSAYLLFLLPKPLKLLIASFLIIVGVYTNRNHLRVNQYTEIPLSLYLSSEITTNSYDEYLPKEVDSNEIKKINRGGAIVSKNNSEISGLENRSNSLAFNYKSELPEDFTIHLFYFPGWEVFIDNKKIDVQKGDLGLINFSAPQGVHRVLINYYGTLLTKLSSYISLITIIVIVLGFFIEPKKLFK